MGRQSRCWDSATGLQVSVPWKVLTPCGDTMGSGQSGSTIDTIFDMASSTKILDRMRREPTSVRFSDLLKVCEESFGKPRQSASSHVVFKTPWPGDPRVNIQNDKGRAKAYQVRQVLLAIDRLKEEKR